MLKQILLVGLGGASGSIIRFLTGELTNKYNSTMFPFATFAVNMLGCFLIGVLISVIPANQSLKSLLIIGFCGGFTTFSSFAKEGFDLINANAIVMAVGYITLSCVVGCLLVFVGAGLFTYNK